MATTRRSGLVDELEKALRDEGYDGGFGALPPEHFTDYVRTLAATAAKVVEERRTPAAGSYWAGGISARVARGGRGGCAPVRSPRPTTSGKR